ncbi:hypothetical protein D4764_12G0010400 [Takifugu flavidus]|uniref:Uncharacterized protein n=1 Tax=Takifugu flavidus TaxID=433684 RepID=A0A5C6PHC5_9TELE|nr:hypothetical protein D4764_12G0010400 [Takifugu flavidus]
MVLRGSSLVISRSGLCSLQMMWSCWRHWPVTSNDRWIGSPPSVKGSKAMVLNRKKVDCLLRVKEEILPQVEEFKYLGVLFTSEGRMKQEIHRRIGAASAVMRTLHQSVVVKRDLSQKAKLSIYRSIFVPTLTYGHELWQPPRSQQPSRAQQPQRAQKPPRVQQPPREQQPPRVQPQPANYQQQQQAELLVVYEENGRERERSRETTQEKTSSLIYSVRRRGEERKGKERRGEERRGEERRGEEARDVSADTNNLSE